MFVARDEAPQMDQKDQRPGEKVGDSSTEGEGMLGALSHHKM